MDYEMFSNASGRSGGSQVSHPSRGSSYLGQTAMVAIESSESGEVVDIVNEPSMNKMLKTKAEVDDEITSSPASFIKSGLGAGIQNLVKNKQPTTGSKRNSLKMINM